MRRLIKYKRVLIVFMLFTMCFVTFSSQASFADTNKDSNSRREELIKFAQGKQTSEIGGLNDLTYNDIQILGVFISNFYTPWQTIINKDDTDNETINDIVDALTKYCGFDEEIAKGIVNACWKVSMNAVPVKVASYNPESRQIINDKSSEASAGTICTYDKFLFYMGGGVGGDIQSYKEQNTDSNYGGKGELGDYCLYWVGADGTPHIVMQSYNSKSVYKEGLVSPSAIATAIALGGVKFENGIGSSFTSKTNKEDAIALANKPVSTESFATGWGLNIDSFGNIFVNTDAGRYVLIPASMNAFTWTDTSGRAGERVPLVNLFSIANTKFNDGEEAQNNVEIYAYEDNGIKYDFHLHGSLFSSDTQWSSWRDYADNERSEATDFKNYVFDKGVNIFASKAEEKKLKFSVKSGADKWYLPNWQDIFPAINSYGSVEDLGYIDDFVYIDDLGKFLGSDKPVLSTASSGIFSNETEEVELSKKEKQVYKPLPEVVKATSNKNLYTMTNGSFQLNATGSQNFLLGIYLSYVLAFADDSTVDYRFNKDGLPPIDSNSLVFDGNLVEDDGTQGKAVQNMIYWLLHPSKGGNYIKQLFKTKVSSILVGTHEDIVGSGGSANLGITKYLGFSGYVTTPELSDLPWTANIVDKYINIFIYLIIIVAVVLVGYVAIGSMTIQKALAGIMIFAVFAYIPPFLVNSTINTANSFSNSIYGSKFMYWALVETQTYSTDIDKYATSGSYSDYLLTLYQNNNAWNDDSTNSISVALKWMCPKKNNYMYSVKKSVEDDSKLKLVNGLFAKRLSGETFISSENANYLYRSYNDISNYSKYIYKHFKTYGIQNVNNETLSALDVSEGGLNRTISEAYEKGFSVLDYNDTTSNIRWKPLYTSQALGNAMLQDFSKANQSQTFGIAQSELNYDLTSVNSASSKLSYGGLIAFAQYTESPFYYFSWTLYDQGLQPDGSSSGNFKDLVLGQKTGGTDSYFYNTKIKGHGEGAMRDFLDMRTLFTNVIPVLREANKAPVKWDELYGLNTYKGVSADPSANADDESTKEEWSYKHWHNVNVAQLWNMYTPWVDAMYDCAYAKPEKISVAGKSFIVKDPINPSSYPVDNGRPMIFSKSEMEYYGLKESDLTTVENKILQIEDDSMKDMYKLMNYYTFNDGVLDTASSMLTTFNFNKVFSENHYISDSYVMFPQNFELKNFTYDAYLRLIMANATGESITAKGDLYETIVNNSSVFTGILLILNDILAVYLVSGLKLFFVLGVFLLSVLAVTASAIRLEINMGSSVIEVLVKPLAKFLAVSIGHAFLVSLFMSDGNLNITGSTNTSISLGDPALTLCMMVLLNAVVIVLYFLIVMQIIKNLIKYTKAVVSSVYGMAGTVVSSATSNLVGGSPLGKLSGRRGTNGADSMNNGVQDGESDIGRTSNLRGMSQNKTSSTSTDDINSKCREGASRLRSNSGTRSKSDKLVKEQNKLLRKKYKLDRKVAISSGAINRNLGESISHQVGRGANLTGKGMKLAGKGIVKAPKKAKALIRIVRSRH